MHPYAPAMHPNDNIRPMSRKQRCKEARGARTHETTIANVEVGSSAQNTHKCTAA